MDFTIELDAGSLAEIEGAIERLADWNEKFGASPETAVNDAAEILLDALQEDAPIGSDTNADRAGDVPLADSIDFDVTAVGDTFEATFSANDYAVYVIDGTAPHEIDPVNTAALHFFFPDGDEAYLSRAMHPGTSANDFRVPAYDSAEPQIMNRLGDIIQEVFQ